MRNIQLTEKIVQTLKEMICGVEINNDIQMAEHEIEKIKYKMKDIEYNELLKMLDEEKLREIIQSRSVYDDTGTLVERIKTTFGVEVTNAEVINKLNNMQDEIDMRQKNIDLMIEDLHDLTSYINRLSENESSETNELFGITFSNVV